MAEESRLQTKVHRFLKRNGWVVNKIILCSMNGFPDTWALKNGRVVLIENKAKGRKLGPLQEYVHEMIKINGGEVYTIDRWEEFLKLKLGK
jgi:hypothetical protein